MMTINKMSGSWCARPNEAGFSLIELMVVVTIIAILASIGIPRMTAFIKTAETTEAVEQMGKISKAIRGYIDSHPDLSVADLNNTTGLKKYKNLGGGMADQLSTLIPHLTLADNATFQYVVNVTVTDTRGVEACIIALKKQTGTTIADAPAILYSEANSLDPVWEGRIFRAGYLNGTNYLGYAASTKSNCGTGGAVQASGT